MRQTAFPKLLPAVVGLAMAASIAPAAAAPAGSDEPVAACGAVIHIGDGLTVAAGPEGDLPESDQLPTAYGDVGIKTVILDAAEGRGVHAASEGAESGVETITRIVQDTETDDPVDGGRCWVVALGSADNLDEQDAPELVKDVIEAVPHDERVMWINVADNDVIDTEESLATFNDALSDMEGEYAQTYVADWASVAPEDEDTEAEKFAMFSAAALLEATTGVEATKDLWEDETEEEGDAPTVREVTPGADSAPTVAPAVDREDTPTTSTEAPAAPTAPAAPAAPSPTTAPEAPTEAPAANLGESFDELQQTIDGTLGVAVAPIGGDVVDFGELDRDVAWSTSKVPIAIAALRAGTASPDDVLQSITVSDNDAAKNVWNSLGDSAATKTEEVLIEGGDSTTTVEDQVLREGFTAFGQTQWAMTDAARFAAGLHGMDDDAATTVKGHMGNIAADQSYGLGKIDGAQFKGGWGPNEAGGYLVRQFGIVDLNGTKAGVAIGVTTTSGGYEQASPHLNKVATWLTNNADALTGEEETPAPEAPAPEAPAPAQQGQASARDGGEDNDSDGPLAGRTVWIDAGHAAETRPGVLISDPTRPGHTQECYTTGTSASDGWPEHTFNWEFTQALKDELEERGATVELGRTSDTGTYECHDVRVAEENDSDADTVISVHADGNDTPGTRGFHIIHRATNPVDGSVELAQSARDSLVNAGYTTSTYLGTNGIHARDDLFGLNNTTKRKILLEMGNMRNSDDLQLLKSESERQKMAEAIAESLIE